MENFSNRTSETFTRWTLRILMIVSQVVSQIGCVLRASDPEIPDTESAQGKVDARNALLQCTANAMAACLGLPPPIMNKIGTCEDSSECCVTARLCSESIASDGGACLYPSVFGAQILVAAKAGEMPGVNGSYGRPCQPGADDGETNFTLCYNFGRAPNAEPSAMQTVADRLCRAQQADMAAVGSRWHTECRAIADEDEEVACRTRVIDAELPTE